MSKVLLVEDSKECQYVVQMALSETNIDLTIASTIDEANEMLQKFSSAPFDLVVLDLSLPDGESYSILDKIRKTNSKETPVFFLSGTGQLDSKITAFNMGADDYLVKPISPLELKVRIESRLKKTSGRKSSTENIQRGHLILDVPKLKASVVDGDKISLIPLTSKEFKILFFLITHEGQYFSRKDLVKNVWGDNIHVQVRTVDSHICGLRKKLNQSANYIECTPGLGYRFIIPESRVAC